MICAALAFTAGRYQSCQAGESAAQENVAGVENSCVRVSVCMETGFVCTCKINMKSCTYSFLDLLLPTAEGDVAI